MRVAILGFGVEGKDAARYFVAKKAEVTVFDKKLKEELDIVGFETHPINWVCGENYLAGGLPNFDLIVRSPGVRPDLPQILEAKKNGAELTSDTKIFFNECKTPIIAVTGTKGKGTTSSLAYEALKSANFKTILLGNIGQPMLESLSAANDCDWVILELSSFQTFDLDKSPKIVVVTNITTDHADWHLNQAEYELAKATLWKNQIKDDFIIFNANDPVSVSLSKKVNSNVYWFSTEEALFNFGAYTKDGGVFLKLGKQSLPIGDTIQFKLPGKHNLMNALAALLASFAAGADTQKAWKGITSFAGLEYRLEVVDEVDGVLYINDSYATNPLPTIAAIHSFSPPKVLIIGGSSKGADFTLLAKEITASNVKAVVLIGDEAKNIESALVKAGFKGKMVSGKEDPSYQLSKMEQLGMEDIVHAAAELAEAGDVVLLSPACASFGLFENYKDRGKQFKEAVKLLK